MVKIINNKNHFFIQILKKQNGIATILILSAISLLTFVIYDFTFNVKLNSIKLNNNQDRQQARLNAEAGLNLALAKLKIYKEAINLVEKDEKIKELVSPNKIEALITSPFVYPIPLPKDSNLIQKNAVKEFEEKSLMVGSLTVEISTISGFLNVNNLRIKKASDATSNNSNEPIDEETKKINAYIEDELVKNLKDTIEQKRENDEFFEAMYSELDATILINELKFYVNDHGAIDGQSEIEQLYDTSNVTPKHAPLTSKSELYLLEGWDDTIVDLIKSKLSVHEVSIIPLNKITDDQLKLLFPQITKEQIDDFFKYRDGVQDTTNSEDEDNDPHPFDSEADFKNLIVNKLQIVTDSEYTSRIETLEKAGLKLGVAGKLFKILSTGNYGSSSYSLEAYVDLPIKPEPTPTPTPVPVSDESKEVQKPQTQTNNDKNKKIPRVLLEPRVIEIFSN